MFSKYLIGFLGVGTVAGGVTATTIALSSNQDPFDNKKAPKGPQEQVTVEQPPKAADEGGDFKPLAADSSQSLDGQEQRQ